MLESVRIEYVVDEIVLRGRHRSKSGHRRVAGKAAEELYLAKLS